MLCLMTGRAGCKALLGAMAKGAFSVGTVGLVTKRPYVSWDEKGLKPPLMHYITLVKFGKAAEMFGQIKLKENRKYQGQLVKVRDKIYLDRTGK